VEAYDTRAAAAEQVQSLGARFVELPLDAGDAEDAGGYARAQSEEFYERQRKLMGERAAAADVVVTTALVPGRPAPRLLDEDAVRSMRLGSVIVYLAAANGGNCALTERDAEVVRHGVRILGPTNLPSDLPTHASQMFSRNLVSLVQHLVHEGELRLDLEDAITQGSLVSHEGAVIHDAVRARLPDAPARGS